MGTETRGIVIWGAGRIGRGFVADLYSHAGYRITFVDADMNLVSGLREKGSYLLLHKYSDGKERRTQIKGFEVLHTEETDSISRVMHRISVMAVSVFPQHFENVAQNLARLICERKKAGIFEPLNVLLCANLYEAGKIMDGKIRSCLDRKCLPYYEKHVGISQCIVIRMAVPPLEKELAEDEWVVVTNGYPELIADGAAWKGDPPDVEGIRMAENISAVEERKLYSYNMLHALYAYLGYRRGLETVYDCTRDSEVQKTAEGALDEVMRALAKKWGTDNEDMREWRDNVLKNMANPSLHDELERVGADPVRKLARNDRLTGAALLCLQNGVEPQNLARAIAAGILYLNERDEKSVEIAQNLQKKGTWKTVEEFCGINDFPVLVRMICEESEKLTCAENPGFRGTEGEKE